MSLLAVLGVALVVFIYIIVDYAVVGHGLVHIVEGLSGRHFVKIKDFLG